MSPEPTDPKEFFGEHAEDYKNSESHAKGEDLHMLVRALTLRPTDRVLDVATGAGHTALSIAPFVSNVVGVDVTEEMLEKGRELANSRAIDNVRFEYGEAEKIGFADSSFDVVTCRRAAHHFKDKERFFSEVKRVLAPGGRFGLADMCPAEGSEDLLNKLERVRDTSHTRALTGTEWKAQVEKAGLKVNSMQVEKEAYTLEKWLSPVKPGGEEEKKVLEILKAASKGELAALGATFGPKDEITGFDKRRIVLVATR